MKAAMPNHVKILDYTNKDRGAKILEADDDIYDYMNLVVQFCSLKPNWVLGII